MRSLPRFDDKVEVLACVSGRGGLGAPSVLHSLVPRKDLATLRMGRGVGKGDPNARGM